MGRVRWAGDSEGGSSAGRGGEVEVQPEPSEPGNGQRWYASQQSLQNGVPRPKAKVSRPACPQNAACPEDKAGVQTACPNNGLS